MNMRLVMMSVSLHTQTGLHCLTIQVLHTRVWRYISILKKVECPITSIICAKQVSFVLSQSILIPQFQWNPKSVIYCGQYTYLDAAKPTTRNGGSESPQIGDETNANI